jgi:hypothetical protein
MKTINSQEAIGKLREALSGVMPYVSAFFSLSKESTALCARDHNKARDILAATAPEKVEAVAGAVEIIGLTDDPLLIKLRSLIVDAGNANFDCGEFDEDESDEEYLTKYSVLHGKVHETTIALENFVMQLRAALAQPVIKESLNTESAHPVQAAPTIDSQLDSITLSKMAFLQQQGAWKPVGVILIGDQGQRAVIDMGRVTWQPHQVGAPQPSQEDV